MVPVNLRPLDQAYKLGNRFGLVPLVLPIGIDNPVERVYAVRARMNALKGSYQPLLAFGVLAVAGLLIKPVQDAMLSLFAQEGDRGDDQRAGPARAAEVLRLDPEQTMFWVPQSGDIGMGVVDPVATAAACSSALITDSALCPDPQKIIDRFEPEFEKLLLVTMMLPWGESAELRSPWLRRRALRVARAGARQRRHRCRR